MSKIRAGNFQSGLCNPICSTRQGRQHIMLPSTILTYMYIVIQYLQNNPKSIYTEFIILTNFDIHSPEGSSNSCATCHLTLPKICHLQEEPEATSYVKISIWYVLKMGYFEFICVSLAETQNQF